ncbi:Larval cuticle protein 8 [Lucilia cuprina]|nr:Larval cuticle protein 8 [Lucilia cuprina]
MKFIIVFAALFAVALAAPRPEDAVVLKSESEVGPESFQYAYATSDGVEAEAQGQLKNVGTDEEAIVVKGSFSFVADDGQTYTVNYVADENGFQPQDTVDSTKSQQQLTADMVNTLKYENSNIGIDGYDFAFETSDGVLRKETATVKNIGTEEEAISVEGTVSWVGPDGVQYTLNYLADENGFQPEVLACLFAVVLSAPQHSAPQHSASQHSASQNPAPQQDDTHAETLRLETENNGVDKYNFAYETSNGIVRSEEGELKTTEDGAAIVVHGTTSWTAPDGKRYEMTFTADELEDATVLRSESEVGPESFQYAYATSDGVEAEAQGQLKNVGTDEEAIVVKGSFSFVADDGQTYTVNYVADENGFQPQGAHLPVAPEA